VAAVTIRFALVGIEAEGVERYAVITVLWSLVLGWVIARADSSGKRLAVSVAAIVATAGFFGDPAREAVVVAGMLLLIWVQQMPVHWALVPALRLLATASLFIYLTHWVVYPAWELSAPWFGTVLSLAIGVAAWYLYRLGGRALNHTVPTGIRGQKSASSRGGELPHITD
jgi:peptidoglycan/LPS O-acetylase OafA/YrhL